MDTSKEYIKMCEKAEEIQPGELNPGDFYVTKMNVYNYIHRICSVQMRRRFFQIRLHRQDQLQEMLMVNGNLTALMQDLWRYASKEFDLDWSKSTMEQLWLAFVMKEKYNKIWNGKEWETK